MDKHVLKLRIFFALILLGAVFYFFYEGVLPLGEISYQRKAGERSYFLRKLTPAERLNNLSSGWEKIIGDPVYFSLWTPRPFSRAKLTVKYKKNGQLPPVLEAGALADKTVWRYDLKPLDNEIINELSNSWKVIAERGTMLLERNNLATSAPLYKNLEEFLSNPPAREKIALYNYDLKKDFFLTDYAAGGTEEIFGLRGAYQFYVYLKEEDLDLDFIFIDLNQNKDSDPLELFIYREGMIIDQRRLADDGIKEDNKKRSGEREMKVKISGLPEGAYKIELKANDDILTKKLASRQSKISFINKIWLYESGAPLALYTNSRQVSAQTANPASLGSLKVGAKNLEISETYRRFILKINKGEKEEVAPEDEFKKEEEQWLELTKLETGKSDLILAGDGLFSFKPESFFNPEFVQVDSGFDADQEGIDYILAGYEKPDEQNGWQIASAEFDLRGAYREKGQYSFIISIPGFESGGDANNLEIKEISVSLGGKSLWEFLKGKLKI